MTPQFSTTNDALKWCIDHPNQRLSDKDGREIWCLMDSRDISSIRFLSNIDIGGNPAYSGRAGLFPDSLEHFDIPTLRPVEAEPEKPTLENLAALENWDKMSIHYPDGWEDHYKAQHGTWAYHYPQLKLALELGWPVEFGGDEK